MLQLGPGELIVDEERFLQSVTAGSQGPPDSWATKSCLRHMERYRVLKGEKIPNSIIDSLNNFINEIQYQESKD